MGRLAGRSLPSRIGGAKSRLVSTRREVSGDDVHRRSTNWYNTSAWKKLRRAILKRDAWICQATGVPLIGKFPEPNSPVVDHKRPHRGNREMFFDPDNLHAVSKAWHDGVKQGLEKRGEA
nr:HNH endonuclease [uncultured Celeribacter sp.]